jgi:hypothetical protein
VSAISISGSDCIPRRECCKAKILELLIAARTPNQLWQVAEGLVVDGAHGIVAQGGSNRCNGVEHDPLTAVPASIPCWWISGRFHLRWMRATSKGQGAGCRQGYLHQKERRRSGVAQNLSPTIRKH